MSKCEHCVFWKQLSNDNDYGHCRRFPPMTQGTGFPVTSKECWCGEFKLPDHVEIP